MTASRCDYSIPDLHPFDMTCTSACSRSCLYVPSTNSEVLMGICDDIKQIDDPVVRMQATAFCDALSGYIGRHDVPALPELYFSLDEGDAFFEWIFDNFRFEFLFCKNPEESGWYMITKVSGKVERIRSTFNGKGTIEYIFSYIGASA